MNLETIFFWSYLDGFIKSYFLLIGKETEDRESRFPIDSSPTVARLVTSVDGLQLTMHTIVAELLLPSVPGGGGGAIL